MRRAIPLVVAALAPGLIIGFALYILGRSPPRVAPAEVAAIDAYLAAAPPDIVAVGNSKTTTDIDPEMLSTLEEPRLSVRIVQAYGSVAPTWYAMLRYRVFEGEHHPRLILVTADVPSMLETLPTGRGLVTLGQQTDAPDDVLARKALGGSPTWARMKEKRGKWRAGVQDAIRDTVVQAAFPSLYANAGGTDDALGRVFAQGSMRSGRDHRAIPVVETHVSSPVSKDVNDSFLPDFVAMAKAHGAHVVFVALPFAPSAARQDRSDPELEQAAIKLLNETGGGWVDLRSLPLSDAHFVDDLHMNAAGRKIASIALEKALVAMGALNAADMADAVLPVRPTRVERIGVATPLPPVERRLKLAPCGWEARTPSLAALSEPAIVEAGWPKEAAPIVVSAGGVALRRRQTREDLGPDCHLAFAHFRAGVRWSADTSGKEPIALGYAPDLPLTLNAHGPAYWVYPGTTLRMTMAEPWKGAEIIVNARVRVFGEGAGTLVVEGVSAPLTGDAATRSVAAPDGAWTLELRSAADGPALLIEHLGFGEADSRGTFIGEDAATTVRLFDLPPRYHTPPPILASSTATLSRGRDLLPIDPALGVLGVDALTQAQLPPCSPLRAVDPTGVLPAVKNAELRGGMVGSVSTRVGVLFNAPPGRAAADFHVGLDVERRCRGARWWLYPGDTVTVDAREARIRGLHRRLTGLVLKLTSVGHGAGTVTIGLTADDREPFITTVPVADFAGGPVTVALPPSFSAKQSLSLSLQIPKEAPYMLIETAVLEGG